MGKFVDERCSQRAPHDWRTERHDRNCDVAPQGMGDASGQMGRREADPNLWISPHVREASAARKSTKAFFTGFMTVWDQYGIYESHCRLQQHDALAVSGYRRVEGVKSYAPHGNRRRVIGADEVNLGHGAVSRTSSAWAATIAFLLVDCEP